MKRSQSRLIFVFFFIITLACVIIARLVYLQIFQHEYLKDRARRQQTAIVRLEYERGLILDRNGIVLARNLPVYSMYADPQMIADKEKAITIIAGETGLAPEVLRDRLGRDKSFVWLKRKVVVAEKERLEKLKLAGVGFLREYKRFYPQEDFLSHVMGLVDIDNAGLDGLELHHNEYLSPHAGEAVVVRDSNGKNLPLYKEFRKGSDGYNLSLNIDAHIQYWAQVALKEAVTSARAKGGAVVVMDPRDGSMLALCNYPSFDPNVPGDSAPEYFRNRAVCDYYEPGSVFKIVALTASLETVPGIEKQTFNCENGQYKIPGSTLHDWHKFGMLAYREVFMQSSNIGVAKVVQQVGGRKFFEYMKKFGFGERTGLDMPYETPGYVKPYAVWSKTSPYIMPIGQEVTVSLVQLARAMSVIANGGYLVKPFIVDKVMDKNGVVIKDFMPERTGPVITTDGARRAREILEQVVAAGTGKKGRVEGVRIGGKTGTAQKINPAGGYSKTNFYATFAGFFPAEAPQFVIAVTIDEARGPFHTGGMIAAPLFGKIAQKIVEYKNFKTVVPAAEDNEKKDIGANASAPLDG